MAPVAKIRCLPVGEEQHAGMTRTETPTGWEQSALSAQSALLDQFLDAPTFPLEDVTDTDEGLEAALGAQQAQDAERFDLERTMLDARESFMAEFLKATRVPLDRLDLLPERPGAFAIYYDPSGIEIEGDGLVRRPRFLELMASEDLPLFVGVADGGATIRERVDDITEFLDQARGLSWEWFRAAAVPVTKEITVGNLRVWLNEYFTYSPWFWMGFDRLLGHQYTEESACTLLASGTGYPSDEARR